MSHLKLTRIEIEGFRKFRDPWTLDLASPAGEPLDYLVLAGPNGCGKTTVLEAILLALGREELIVRDIEAKERPTSPRVQLGREARLVAVVRDLDSGAEYHVERTADGIIPRCPLPDGRLQRYEWEILGDKLAPLAVEYVSSRRIPALVGPVQDAIKGRPPDPTEANRIRLFKHRVRQQQSALPVVRREPQRAAEHRLRLGVFRTRHEDPREHCGARKHALLLELQVVPDLGNAQFQTEAAHRVVGGRSGLRSMGSRQRGHADGEGRPEGLE